MRQKNNLILFILISLMYLPDTVFSQNYTSDSLAVRAILNSNGLTSTQVGNISDSSNGRIIILYLNLGTLTEIPPQIGNITDLEQLWLYKNYLSSLPSEINKLVKLKILWINNNSFKTLPTVIGELTSLTSLAIYDNHLESLPAEIGNLSNLDELQVDHNDLTSIPSEIGKLSKLTFFSCAFNNLTTLPNSCAKLKPVNSVDIGNNKISPDSLSLEVRQWADTYDPDWLETQDITSVLGNTITSFPSLFSVQYTNHEPYILIRLPYAMHIALDVYSAGGKLHKTLIDAYKNAGTHIQVFNKVDFASGVYYLKFSNDHYGTSQKVLISK